MFNFLLCNHCTNCNIKEEQLSSIDLLKSYNHDQEKAIKNTEHTTPNQITNDENTNELQVIDYPYPVKPANKMKLFISNTIQKTVPVCSIKSRMNTTQISKLDDLDNTLNDEFSEDSPSMKNTYRTETNGNETQRIAVDSMINGGSFSRQMTEVSNNDNNKKALNNNNNNNVVKKDNKPIIKMTKKPLVKNNSYRIYKKIPVVKHQKSSSINGEKKKPLYCIYCEEIYKALSYNNISTLPNKSCIYCNQKITLKTLEQYKIDHPTNTTNNKDVVHKPSI